MLHFLKPTITTIAPYFVEDLLAAITVSSLLEYDGLSLVHLFSGGFSHCVLCLVTSQAPSSWMGSAGTRYRSLQRYLLGFKSVLLLGHLKTKQSQSQSFLILAVCLGSLSCWKINLYPSLRSRVLLRRLSSRYIMDFIFPSTLTTLPGPATKKRPHSMILPTTWHPSLGAFHIGDKWLTLIFSESLTKARQDFSLQPNL